MKKLEYNNIQKWIPSTDIDGIDIKPEIASVVRNVVLRNGFIRNEVDTINKVLPANVQSWIFGGYSLIAYTNFYHSIQGMQEVFILWSSSESAVSIHLGEQIIKIDDFAEYTICESKPSNINFSVVNDELKINLNCYATLRAKRVILNLTLLYFDEEIRYTGANGVFTNSFSGTGVNDLLGINNGMVLGDSIEVKISTAVTPDTPMSVVFTGTGLDDLIVEELIKANNVYEVIVDSQSLGFDFIRWRVNSGSWSDPVMLFMPLTINGQLRISMLSLQGHTLGDYWTITTYAGSGGTDKFVWRLNSGTWSSEINIDPIYYNSYGNIGNLSILFLSKAGHTVDDIWTFAIEPVTGLLIKDKGWGCYPRWIGWAKDKEVATQSNLYEDFEDGVYIQGFSIPNVLENEAEIGVPPIAENFGNNFAGKALFVQDSTGEYRQGYAQIINLKMVGKVKFTVVTANMGMVSDSGVGVGRIVVEILGTASRKYISTLEFSDDSKTHEKVELDIPFKKYTGETLTLRISFYTPPRIIGFNPVLLFPNTVVGIEDLEIEGNKIMVLEKLVSRQRGLIYGLTQITDTEFITSGKLRLLPNLIDPRVSSYEIYIKSNEVYQLIAEINITDLGWNTNGNYLEHSIENNFDVVETLNFNYGLGEGVRVDEQHKIYSEVIFNNRVYTIADSYLIRQSHISGSGAIQPDSFPFSPEDNYGFIEESKNKVLKSLFIINNNFLLLIMDGGFSVYMIQSNRGALQKELRLLMNPFTGFNPKSLTRDITGVSTTAGAYFVTNEGIFFHDGSLGSLPVNLIVESHKLYWRTVEKTNFGFYDYQDNEYWYATKVYREDRDDPLGEGGREFTEFIIYEVDYKSFRFVRLEKAYYEFAGYTNGKPLLRTDSKIDILDKTNTKSLNSYVEMHKYDGGSEFYNKIAQYLQIELKQPYLNSSLLIRAQFDNQPITYSYLISTNEVRMIRILPLSVRFKHVVISIVFNNKDLKPLEISKFCLYYTEDGIGRMAELHEHPSFDEDRSQYGKKYGRYYW